VPRIVDESDEPIGRELICQTLHPLATRGPHLGDLRHGQGAQQREAPHEAERAAAPARDEPSLLAEGPYPEEALSHFEHQLGDRLSLAINYRSRRFLWDRHAPTSRQAVAPPFLHSVVSAVRRSRLRTSFFS
jgi:hypothetical protein